MCAFGGSNFDTLFITSIRPTNEIDLLNQPLAGAVFSVRPGVQGLPETEFDALT
jgi:sugar lactone lactonase YvrE